MPPMHLPLVHRVTTFNSMKLRHFTLFVPKSIKLGYMVQEFYYKYSTKSGSLASIRFFRLCKLLPPGIIVLPRPPEPFKRRPSTLVPQPPFLRTQPRPRVIDDNAKDSTEGWWLYVGQRDWYRAQNRLQEWDNRGDPILEDGIRFNDMREEQHESWRDVFHLIHPGSERLERGGSISERHWWAWIRDDE